MVAFGPSLVQGASSVSVFTHLTHRLSTRVAATTSALALFFLACMGVGAWLVTSRVVLAQAEHHLVEAARIRAAYAADILAAVTSRMADIATGSALGPGQAPAIAVQTRPLSRDAADAWDRQAALRGVAVGRLLADEGGVVELAVPGADGAAGLVWRLHLVDLAHRLAAGQASGAGEVVVVGGGLRLVGAWGRPPAEDAVAAEAEIGLPAAFNGITMTVRAVADPGQMARPMRTLTFWLLAMGGCGIVLAVALATVMSRRLTHALSALADAAQSYAIGAGDAASFHVRGNDEIARLGQAFAAMVERLAQAYRDLDHRSQTLLSNAERVARIGSATWRPGQDGQIWSAQFHMILGLVPGEVEPGRDILFARVHPADRGRLDQALARAMAADGGPVVEDFRIIRADGAERVAQFRAEVARTVEGRPVRVDATLQDITERKHMEVQLDDLVRELKRSNEELEQFAYVASHDLRQPLRTVRSYLTLIEDSIDEKLDVETREFMDFIRDGVKRMDALITDLLAYSRVGRRVADGPVDMGRMVDLSILDLQAQVDETGARIEIAGPLPVVGGDSGEITRLFQNLLGNALKYRRTDQVPTIHIGCVDGGSVWDLSVADNGIGIPVEHRERAFGIFQRLHGRHEYEGTGIGLAICRKIVERHGGTIWVEDTPLGGATFRFTWPKLRRQIL